MRTNEPIQFSLLFFSSQDRGYSDNKYELFIEGAKLADKEGLCAVWIPERHFHPFGGLFPNPSVLAASLAMITGNVRLRSGSIVLPLHNPIRVVEEWSVVDNLSKGRVDLSFAIGWNPNDYAIAPEAYSKRKQLCFSGIKTIQKLWKGETINLQNGLGKSTSTKIYPLPQQKELNIWLTCSGGSERFVEAGSLGANVLTALLFQPIEELEEKIKLYRSSFVPHAQKKGKGHVTVMLHTFVGKNLEAVREKVHDPFSTYLRSSVELWSTYAKSLDSLSPQEEEKLLDYAFERYFRTKTLFGTPDTCMDMGKKLASIGVDEIACLIDFGVDTPSVLESLHHLGELKQTLESS